jgi:hypothetical protein
MWHDYKLWTEYYSRQRIVSWLTALNVAVFAQMILVAKVSHNQNGN